MYTKAEQLKKTKNKKISSFGTKKYTIKKKINRTPEREEEKSFLSWLHNSNQRCVICGNNKIEVHHITDIKRIKDEPRRRWNRVVCLCVDHHRIGKEAIHVLSKDIFYENVMSFYELILKSENIYTQYLKEKKK